MKFIPLHTKNTAIIYKNSLCSSATVIVLVFIVLSIMIPVFLVSLLSPYSGIAESRILYEQPKIQFKFQYLFVGEFNNNNNNSKTDGLITCSSFANFNERMEPHSTKCHSIKYWAEDMDHDNTIDRAHFQLNLEPLKHPLLAYELAIFFDMKLKHKCELAPPALLTHNLNIPISKQLTNGTILLKGEIQLKQYVEFICPFPGRHSKTYFRDVMLNTNSSSASLEQFRMGNMMKKLKSNPAYFQIIIEEKYFLPDNSNGLRIQLDIDIPQIPARYHLSIWERLGQFWLYFASFFGISFYIMNKLKDFLFSRHIIRSWEIIPWKKLY